MGRPRIRPSRLPVLVGSVSLTVALTAGVAPITASAGAPLPRTARAQPVVREVPVAVAGRVVPGRVVQTAPQPVEGFGVVGATWLGKPPAGLRLDVRTEASGGWSAWQPLTVADIPQGGDPAARGLTRAGTDPLAVGQVEAVQLRVSSASGRTPRGLELSVVDPGADPAPLAAGRRAAAGDRADDEDKPVPGIRAPLPKLRLRADWGADRKLRTGTPQYGEVDAGFVHHTVNANEYTREDVPAIIRGVYAYHTQSLGWSDIGYNFLVDKFGRIWVGRAGGPRKPVIGAQVFGFNHLSTGVSVIGNFETGKPNRDILRALGRLLGWKLGLHGVRVPSRHVLNDERLSAINGHRDAGQTLCPGINLYKRLPAIRRIAHRWQQQ